MFKQTVSGLPQNQEVAHGVSTGPVCWYPGPEMWTHGTGLEADEHEIALNGAGLAQGEDLLFA
jgi:hypothetical protein